MQRQNSIFAPAPRFIFFLMLAVFISELAVMELFAVPYGRLGVFRASLLDAATLASFFTVILWFFLIEPLFARDIAVGKVRRSFPRMILLKGIIVIFLVEFLSMYLLAVLCPGVDVTIRNIADAGITALLVTLFLWRLLPPEKRLTIDSLINLLNTPVKLFIILIVAVFMVDFLEIPLENMVAHHASPFSGKLVDAFLSTLLISPLLWLLVIRPLRRTAIFERSCYDAIRDQVVEAVVTIDSDGVIEAFNPAAEEILGYRSDEVVGKSAAILSCGDILTPAALNMIDSAPEKSRSFRSSREVACRRQDGLPMVLEISVSRVVLDRREQFLAFMRDISGRKAMEEALRESEARFRQLFEQSEDAIIFFKPGTCTVIDANRTAELLYGVTREELKARGADCFCRLEDLARFSATISELRDQAVSHLGNFRQRCADGAEIIVSVYGKVINIQGVDLTYCSFRNISERVRMEEESRNIQAKLIQANKMTSLGLLVSGVAHEINNPNNSIMANSQLLERAWHDALKILREYHRENGDFLLGGIPFSVFGESSRDLFSGIIDGSRRINDIVNNLKGYARAGTAQGEEVSVNQVVTAAVNILHYQLIRHTDRFHLDLDEDIPCIKGSCQQLVQVVTNLVMNACQSISDKQCGIWVTTGFDTASGQVTITVRDEGHGIPETISDKILEPFFTTRLDSGGTGLGLFITQSIIREHSGSLGFTSEPGRGTTFVVKIPAADAVAEEYSP